ncbi:MAG: OmpA family protein [Cytophagales bacterium]|nr:OmpA family protein [Cytophagales bacterium]
MQAKKILFESGSAVIKKESYPILDGLVTLLNIYPYAEFDIEGHTDNTGTPESNKQLSQERAQSVVNYFVSKGIAKERLTAHGYGQERPIADNKTAAGRAQNRRVEIHLNQK